MRRSHSKLMAVVGLSVATVGAFGLSCGDRGELLATIPSDGSAGATGAAGGVAAEPQLGPFEAPTLIPQLSAPGSYSTDPSLTADLLELYFVSARTGSADIWVARREDPQAVFGEPTLVAELSSEQSDDTPAVSEDGLSIWFTSERPALHKKKNIWGATRSSRGDVWGPPFEAQDLNTDSAELAPAIASGGLLLAFASDRAGQTASDIFLAARPTLESAWELGVLLPELRSEAEDWDPSLGDGGQQLFFSSSRTGSGDLYWTSRPSSSDAFSAPVPISELNSTAVDSDPTLSPDLRYIIFSSNRSGRHELYEAHR